jgi:hypothetical protein
MVNKTEDDIAVPADVTAEATLAEQSGDPERGDNANDVVGAGGVEVIKAATFDSRTAITASLKDHFTLHVASSLVRYRDVHCAARVIQNLDSQFILEESYDPKAKVRSKSYSSYFSFQVVRRRVEPTQVKDARCLRARGSLHRLCCHSLSRY